MAGDSRIWEMVRYAWILGLAKVQCHSWRPGSAVERMVYSVESRSRFHAPLRTNVEMWGRRGRAWREEPDENSSLRAVRK